MTALFLLSFLGAGLGLFFWVTRDRDGRRHRSLLRRRYLQLSLLSPRDAENELAKDLALIRREHPERSGVWHLKRLLAEQNH